jgi:hypothetical protein
MDTNMCKNHKLVLLLRRFAVGDVYIRFLIRISVLGLLVPLISFLFSGEQKRWFAWFILYIPLVWFVWIICAVFWGNRQRILKLIFLWLVIDVSALLFFLSFSMGMAQWEKANGADVVVYMMYFPVIFPAYTLIYLAPNELINVLTTIREFLVVLFPIVIRGVLSFWLSVSLLAALQSIAIVCCSMLMKKILFFNKAKNPHP